MEMRRQWSHMERVIPSSHRTGSSLAYLINCGFRKLVAEAFTATAIVSATGRPARDQGVLGWQNRDNRSFALADSSWSTCTNYD